MIRANVKISPILLPENIANKACRLNDGGWVHSRFQ
jgi:hypothetical protein